MDQDQADHPAGGRAPERTHGGEQAALDRHLQHDLAGGHTQVTQHAELARARQGLRRIAAGNAEQRHQQGGRFQQIGHGEAAVEDAQGQGAQFARAAKFGGRKQGFAAGKRRDHAVRCGAGPQPQGDVIYRGVAGDAAVVVAHHGDGAMLARVVAVDAGHVKRLRRNGQPNALARRVAVQIDHAFGDVERQHPRRRRHGRPGERQARRGRSRVNTARQQGHRRPRRVEREFQRARELGAHHAGLGGYARL